MQTDLFKFIEPHTKRTDFDKCIGIVQLYLSRYRSR